MEALDALLDRGADIEARGGVIGYGTPLDDAVAFKQWKAAERLAKRSVRGLPSTETTRGLFIANGN